jgi:hypothetical protein
MRRHFPETRSRVGVMGLAVIMTACGAPAAPNAAIGHDRRVEVVEMVLAGQLTERDESGSVVLPDDDADLSHLGVIEVRDDPFMVFFTTWTGSSPDPYCGYEYSADPTAVEVDPRFSGTGEARPLDAQGWYWICAS